MTLIDMPTTRSVYRRAVTGLARRRTAETLPETVWRVAEVEVDRAALAEYDRVCEFRLTDALPATYPHVMAFPIAMHLMSEPEFPFGVIGLVHIANTITQLRPIDASERLTFTVSAADLRPHDRGRQFDVIAVATVAGAEVWRGVSTYLRRDGSTTSEKPKNQEAQTYQPKAIWAVRKDIGTAYAKVSGDRNPIHVSALGAKAFGFPGPIAHGMWSAARCLAAMEGELADAYTYEVVFKRPIVLPSTVAFSQRGAELALTSARSGEPHLTATLTDL